MAQARNRSRAPAKRREHPRVWDNVVTKLKWILFVVVVAALASPSAMARRKKRVNLTDDPTYQLYQLLNNSYGGRVKNFYLAGDVYADPSHPGSQLQHFLRVEYNKSLFFGRLEIYVRSVSKPTEDQMKVYTAKQLYHFGEEDLAEYEKINPGPIGQPGDLYLKLQSSRGTLESAPITPRVADEYSTLVSQYIKPALQASAQSK